MCVSVHGLQMFVEVREQHEGAGHLLPSSFKGLNSGPQSWWQTPFLPRCLAGLLYCSSQWISSVNEIIGMFPCVIFTLSSGFLFLYHIIVRFIVPMGYCSEKFQIMN